MAITTQKTRFSGKLLPTVNMKDSGIKASHTDGECSFFIYSFEVPFTPTVNSPYENLNFIDIHGNRYNTADLVIWEKLDIGGFAIKNPTTGVYNFKQITDFMVGKSPIGLAQIGQYYYGENQFYYYSVDKDPFDPYTFDILDNVTDGFYPFDPAIEVNKRVAPLPAIATALEVGGDCTIETIKTISATSPEDVYYLPKLNVPYFLRPAFGTLNKFHIMRTILFARPFSARP